MPHEPKRRHSTQRKGKRRASISLSIPKAIACPNCAQMMLPHHVCPHCGYYKGQEMVKPKQRVVVTK